MFRKLKQSMFHKPELSMAHRPELSMAHRPDQRMAHRPDQSMAHRPEAAKSVESSLSDFIQELTSCQQSDGMSISSGGGPPEDGSVLLKRFNRVADQRDAARRDLSFSMEAIEELKTHVSGLNRLLIDAQRELESRRPIDSRQRPRVEAKSREIWIANIWFSQPSLRCIRDAEKEWLDGNPQQALNTMLHRLASDDLDFEEHMMCRLLIAAIFYRSDDTERSMQVADEVLKSCQSYSRKDPFLAGEIAGIAQFLRGKSFMSHRNWAHAYWAFARVSSNSKYKTKAQRLKRKAAEFFPEKASIPYVPPSAATPLMG